ncbi:MAG TPA: 5-formyltetrahydrofolate cyclo-ligase [Rectinemataceae bacterium]|nr:5-formyltetrahydrofolate cyclo-ligase [Rectinemataceae bacterium]
MSLTEEKAEARKRIKALLKAMDLKEAEERSLRATDNFRALPEYVGANIILAFLSMGGEIQTESLIGTALAEGKVVAVPRMESSPEAGHFIVFVPLPRDYRSWPRDRYGIPEPPSNAQELSEEELYSASVIVATPGLAFDRRGGRLGRGKGYYDRFLSGVRAGAARLGGGVFACGFCYAAQLMDEVPRGEGDMTVDLVVTEDGCLGR